nr:SUMF1/EgtB/PvdO family nonheme iron enzyme [uncultured Hyphomonas sp.]
MRAELIRRSRFAITSLFLAGVVPNVAVADPWPPVLVNPQPLDGDFVLPLPCDGEMVFRKVRLPVSGVLADHAFQQGGSDEDWDYSENPIETYLSGGFEDKDGQYYYIAKYEVNQLQYDAVMSEDCATPTPMHRLPKTQISWFDAIAFSDKLSTWLLTSAADKLPQSAGAKAFVRLPTEAEWEYAARGGMKVSATEFIDRMFPTKTSLNDYVWYSGSSSANGKLQMMGLKSPNPLGLFDIVGNADEMTMDLYHLNKGSRMHGLSGGYIIRGGNFRTPREQIRTAQREEAPFYIDTGPRTSPATGFRPVLSTIAIASLKRLDEIKKEWKTIGSDVTGLGEVQPQPIAVRKVAKGKSENPIEELELIADAIQDNGTKQRLADVRNVLKSSMIARDEQRDRAVKSSLRLGAFLCANLYNGGNTVELLQNSYDARCATNDPAQRCDKRAEQLDAEKQALRGNLEYYSDTIVRSAMDFSPELIDQQSKILRREMEARDLGSIADWADIYGDQVKFFSEDGKIKRRDWLSDCMAGTD